MFIFGITEWGGVREHNVVVSRKKRSKGRALQGMHGSGKRLRALIDECGVTPTGISRLLGVSPQVMNNWFARGVPKRRLCEVGALFRIDPRWLEFGSGIGMTNVGQPDKSNEFPISIMFQARKPVIGLYESN